MALSAALQAGGPRSSQKAECLLLLLLLVLLLLHLHRHKKVLLCCCCSCCCVKGDSQGLRAQGSIEGTIGRLLLLLLLLRLLPLVVSYFPVH